MLTVFFDRANPDSTAAKPRFMKNTSIAARSTHKVSIAILKSIYDPPSFLSILSIRRIQLQTLKLNKKSAL